MKPVLLPDDDDFVMIFAVSKTPGKTGAWLVEDQTDAHGGEGGNHSAHTSKRAAFAAVRDAFPSVVFVPLLARNLYGAYLPYADWENTDAQNQQEAWEDDE